MGLEIDGYAFDGPYASDMLKNASGVYALICFANGVSSLIDIGSSSDVKTHIASHDTSCWNRNCQGGQMQCYIYYCDERTRAAVENTIRAAMDPPCG